YWALGERYLLVENNPVGDPTPEVPATLIAETTWGGQRVKRTLRVIGAQPASTITTGAAGWVLEVHQDDRNTGYPLADFGDNDRTTLRAALFGENVSPAIFMLQMLLSGSGNGFNHPTYDVFPFGCNLPE